MNYTCTLDIVAIFIYLIIIFSLIFRKTYRWIFGAMGIVNLLATIFDLLAVTMPHYYEGMVFFNSIYLLLRLLSPVMFFIYATSLTDSWHRLWKRHVLCFICAIPYLSVIVLIVINLFNPILFVVDEAAYYQRGSAYVYLYIAGSFYLFLGAFYIFRYRVLFTRGKLIALFMMIPFSATAVLIQGIYPHLLVEMFSAAFCWLFLTITVERAEEQVDPITGLGPQKLFNFRIKRNYLTEKSFTIIIFKVTNYRILETLMGHEGGEQLKKKIAYILIQINRQLRAFAELYYCENGAFAVVLNEKRQERVREYATQIESMINHQSLLEQLTLDVNIVPCVVKCPEEMATFDALINFNNHFTQAIDFSEQSIVYLSEITYMNKVNQIIELPKIILQALKDKKFEVYYQPIYTLKEQRVRSAEALLRLRDDKYGFIFPDLFIPMAEADGSIIQIGEYVFEEVCRFIKSKAFQELGLRCIEINLSIVQCMERNLSDTFLRIMRKYDVSPSCINLEITESATNYNEHIINQNIRALYEAGISFSLDDYGTGYSNIKRVAQLPLAIIKLDRSFVIESDDLRMQSIIQDTIQMIKNLQLEIVVEGIETKKELDYFVSLGCDYVQGYYFSKPMEEQSFIQCVKKINGET